MHFLEIINYVGEFLMSIEYALDLAPFVLFVAYFVILCRNDVGKFESSEWFQTQTVYRNSLLLF